MSEEELRGWAKAIALLDGKKWESLGRDARRIYVSRAKDQLGIDSKPRCGKEKAK